MTKHTGKFRLFFRWAAGRWPGFWETASYVSVTLAFFEYQHNRAKEHLESAMVVYRELDHSYIEYVKVCFDHPRLDCYAAPAEKRPDPPLTADELVQQKVLYDMLTDMFESAYVHFLKFRDRVEGDEAKKLYDDQWDSWETYIGKFVVRPAYLSVWFDVQDGYDIELRCHMKRLIRKSLVAATLDTRLQQRFDDWLALPEIRSCK